MNQTNKSKSSKHLSLVKKKQRSSEKITVRDQIFTLDFLADVSGPNSTKLMSFAEALTLLVSTIDVSVQGLNLPFTCVFERA